MTSTALLRAIADSYSLTPISVGEFAKLKANGMKFTIRAYHADGLGHVSIMTAKGFFGLMKMDTLMVVPQEKDLPLYSYDRIYAMGNDTLVVELYDTLTQPIDLSMLNHIKSKFRHLEERDPGVHWYDSIKLPESISKKGKKEHREDLDTLALEHFSYYLHTPTKKVADLEKKNELSAKYVDGLLSHGGPATDVFIKSLGEEKTAKLFHAVLFGTQANG